MPAPDPRPAHRPPSKVLDESLVEALCGHIRDGHFAQTACRLVGLPKETFHRWLRRGEAEADDPMSIYAAFVRAIESAEAQAESDALAAVRRATMPWTKRTVRTVRVGDRVKTETEETSMPGSWLAAAWYLERARGTRYGRRKTIEHTGEVQHVKRVQFDTQAVPGWPVEAQDAEYDVEKHKELPHERTQGT